ncbi:hypothetical protein [Martelella limonii]|uniref:hypothetical protein n=1 Tax=Martelella limonii TaxID=1647649 RepID=UPI00158006E9|nr:hypothetical protein [Martelella limonii]
MNKNEIPDFSSHFAARGALCGLGSDRPRPAQPPVLHIDVMSMLTPAVALAWLNAASAGGSDLWCGRAEATTRAPAAAPVRFTISPNRRPGGLAAKCSRAPGTVRGHLTPPVFVDETGIPSIIDAAPPSALVANAPFLRRAANSRQPDRRCRS